MEELTGTQQPISVQEINSPLFQAKGWMKLIGVMSIIYGAINAITIVGIVIAWLPIWVGVIIFQSASAAEEAQLTGRKEPLIRSLNKLSLYFKIMGVLMLVGLVLIGAAILVAITGGLIGLSHMQ